MHNVESLTWVIVEEERVAKPIGWGVGHIFSGLFEWGNGSNGIYDDI